MYYADITLDPLCHLESLLPETGGQQTHEQVSFRVRTVYSSFKIWISYKHQKFKTENTEVATVQCRWECKIDNQCGTSHRGDTWATGMAQWVNILVSSPTTWVWLPWTRRVEKENWLTSCLDLHTYHSLFLPSPEVNIIKIFLKIKQTPYGTTTPHLCMCSKKKTERKNSRRFSHHVIAILFTAAKKQEQFPKEGINKLWHEPTMEYHLKCTHIYTKTCANSEGTFCQVK